MRSISSESTRPFDSWERITVSYWVVIYDIYRTVLPCNVTRVKYFTSRIFLCVHLRTFLCNHNPQLTTDRRLCDNKLRIHHSHFLVYKNSVRLYWTHVELYRVSSPQSNTPYSSSQVAAGRGKALHHSSRAPTSFRRRVTCACRKPSIFTESRSIGWNGKEDQFLWSRIFMLLLNQNKSRTARDYAFGCTRFLWLSTVNATVTQHDGDKNNLYVCFLQPPYFAPLWNRVLFLNFVSSMVNCSLAFLRVFFPRLHSTMYFSIHLKLRWSFSSTPCADLSP